MKKPVWKIISLGSVVLVLALGGGAGYLWTSGMVDGVKFQKIIALLQGQEQVQESVAPVEPAAPPEEAEQALVRVQTNDEVAWRNHMRRLAELEQRKTVVQLEMLRVEKAREAFQRQQDLIDQQLRARKQLDRTEGFQKELDLVAQMKPKQALEYLLAKAPEDAAHMILKMDERSAKRVVQSAKSSDEKTKLNGVLELMKEMSVSADETTSTGVAGSATKQAAQPAPSTG